MKKNIFFLIGLLVFIISCQNDKERVQKLNTIKQKISTILNQKLKSALFNNVHVGIHIVTVDDKYVLFERDINRPYIPASAFKIIPSAISLIKFGTEYQFETSIFYKFLLVNHCSNNKIHFPHHTACIHFFLPKML